MLEIRFHGRGGQGAVIGSEVLAQAFFLEGKYVQAFPAFGVERRGAPVTAFCRVSPEPIHLRNQITHPDHVVVLDASLNVHVARQLQERQIVREYRVGVDREPEAEQGRLDSTVDGKPAALQYRRSEPGCLRVRLETGRTHQIRIQLAEIGCPVTGDTRYGGSRGALRLRAVRLAFKHPVSEKSIDVKAPDSWYAEPAETLIEEPSTDTTQ